MKKKTIRILAVAAATALLLGGAYLLTRDDIAQKISENELLPFRPSVIAQGALDYSAPDATNNTETSTSETTITDSTTTCLVRLICTGRIGINQQERIPWSTDGNA